MLTPTQAETVQILEQVKNWLLELNDRAVKDIRNAAARELTKRYPSVSMEKYEAKLLKQKQELLEQQKRGVWKK